MKQLQKRKKSIIFLTRGAVIAALYTTLTYLVLPIGSGVIQFRISEMLCIMPMFFPEAIPGLYVGCILANILSSANVFDVIFGSLATLIGALGAYLCRALPYKLRWLSTLPTVVANTVIVPLVLIYAYGAEGGFLAVALTVGLGELLSAGVLGSLLYYGLSRTGAFRA